MIFNDFYLLLIFFKCIFTLSSAAKIHSVICTCIIVVLYKKSINFCKTKTSREPAKKLIKKTMLNNFEQFVKRKKKRRCFEGILRSLPILYINYFIHFMMVLQQYLANSLRGRELIFFFLCILNFAYLSLPKSACKLGLKTLSWIVKIHLINFSILYLSNWDRISTYKKLYFSKRTKY